MSYQNINYFNGGYTEPIQFNQVFNNTCTIEDWFNPTAASNSTTTSTEDFQQLLQLLPISPPLTASPVSDGENEMVSNEALVALFPDILNQQTTPKPVQIQQQRRPVAIMPKTAIPIAPRPGVFTPTMNSTKRKVDPQKDNDEISQKRQKNTDAARRSRLKKIVKMETLEKQVNELEADNSRLTTRVAVLESEKTALVSKDIGLEDRIRVLEAQLAEAHRALTCKSSQ
ncbi:hypothetical protein EDC94DRAFT_594017 [Helicostylum pulchrum]|uniref:BZIP domain-containing protein n=1 Tax=Helicostylum pulchrum TaxID=562976 RepID=A0ABP9XRY5_9FUNG|nr:hypothetical protein EDC94DRAFT_594017 [Helicostylum pulchrum]